MGDVHDASRICTTYLPAYVHTSEANETIPLHGYVCYMVL